MKKFKIDKKIIKEQLLSLKSQFDKDAAIYLALLLGTIFYGTMKFIIPTFEDLTKNFKILMEKRDSVETMQKKVSALQKAMEKKQAEDTVIPVKIFETPYKGMELENASAGFVNKIIQVIKKNGLNKILSLEFEKKPLTDRSGIESKEHSVLQLKIEMESSYDVIQSIINDIYLMDYLVKINTISLSSMKKYNYQKVKAFFILDLFVETS